MDLIWFDRGLAVVAFGITIWQIRKAHSAAVAARRAAGEAVAVVRRFEAATRMQDIASRSRDLLRLLRSKGSLAPAASAAFELRDAVARYRHDTFSKRLVDEDLWQEIARNVRSIHDRLESLSMARASADDREVLLHEVSHLHTQFAEFAAKASVEGTSDANPK